MQHVFRVEDMSCGHCVSAVTKAVREADPGAEVTVDLEAHRVVVEGERPRDDYAKVIREAGYTPA